MRSAEASRRLGALDLLGSPGGIRLDGGRQWEVLAGFGGGGFFSTKNEDIDFKKNKSEDVERDLATFCWLCRF